jgi:hypothetical protein
MLLRLRSFFLLLVLERTLTHTSIDVFEVNELVPTYWTQSTDTDTVIGTREPARLSKLNPKTVLVSLNTASTD